MKEQAKIAVVLVVEDESLLRSFAVGMVEDAGFETIEAGNADEAIAILETRADITILLTDINMPGSIDGQCWLPKMRWNGASG